MDDELIKQAKKRVKDKKDFYSHFSVYLAVGAFFFAMNVLNWEGEWWFYFPLLPWGIGVLIHYFGVFGIPYLKVLTPEWEEKELEEEIKKLKELDVNPKPAKEEDQLILPDLKKKPQKKVQKKWNEDDLV